MIPRALKLCLQTQPPGRLPHLLFLWRHPTQTRFGVYSLTYSCWALTAQAAPLSDHLNTGNGSPLSSPAASLTGPSGDSEPHPIRCTSLAWAPLPQVSTLQSGWRHFLTGNLHWLLSELRGSPHCETHLREQGSLCSGPWVRYHNLFPTVPFVLVNFFHSCERCSFSSLQIRYFPPSERSDPETSHHTALLSPPATHSHSLSLCLSPSFCLVNSYSRSLAHWDLQQGSFCWGLGLGVKLLPPDFCCHGILCSWRTLLIIMGLKSLPNPCAFWGHRLHLIRIWSPLNTRWMNSRDVTHKVNHF